VLTDTVWRAPEYHASICRIPRRVYAAAKAVDDGSSRRRPPASERVRGLREDCWSGCEKERHSARRRTRAPRSCRSKLRRAWSRCLAGGKHRLLVTAHMADGSEEDFTHQAIYQANNPEVAAVSGDGVVSARKPGETDVLAWAAGYAASSTVGIVGAPVAGYPDVPRFNFIDEYVFSKLRTMRIVPSDLSSDTEFLRRVCLDLTGTLPPPERVREFVLKPGSKETREGHRHPDCFAGIRRLLDLPVLRSVPRRGVLQWHPA
jgi:hypothetical protein